MYARFFRHIIPSSGACRLALCGHAPSIRPVTDGGLCLPGGGGHHSTKGRDADLSSLCHRWCFVAQPDSSRDVPAGTADRGSSSSGPLTLTLRYSQTGSDDPGSFWHSSASRSCAPGDFVPLEVSVLVPPARHRCTECANEESSNDRRRGHGRNDFQQRYFVAGRKCRGEREVVHRDQGLDGTSSRTGKGARSLCTPRAHIAGRLAHGDSSLAISAMVRADGVGPATRCNRSALALHKHMRHFDVARNYNKEHRK
jgi:hypothetical protein